MRSTSTLQEHHMQTPQYFCFFSVMFSTQSSGKQQATCLLDYPKSYNTAPTVSWSIEILNIYVIDYEIDVSERAIKDLRFCVNVHTSQYLCAPSKFFIRHTPCIHFSSSFGQNNHAQFPTQAETSDLKNLKDEGYFCQTNNIRHEKNCLISIFWQLWLKRNMVQETPCFFSQKW